MQWKLKYHYDLARVLLGLVVIFTGFQMLSQGAEFYSPFLHAWRKMIAPDSKNKISDGMTWEMVNKNIVQGFGALMILGGALVLINMRKAGGVAIMIVISFMILTQDNPMIKSFIRPKPKNMNLRVDDLARHLSLMGTCLFMLVCPPYTGDEEDAEIAKAEKDSKKKKNKVE